MDLLESLNSSSTNSFITTSMVSNLSHLTFTCPTSESLKETIEFYQNIGFNLAHNPHEELNKKQEEVWLSYSLVKAGLKGGGDLVNRYNYGGKELLIKVNLDEEIETVKGGSGPITFHFCVPDLKGFKENLCFKNLDFTEDLDNEELVLIDPIGTKLKFSKRLTPFSSSKVVKLPSLKSNNDIKELLESDSKDEEKVGKKKKIAVLTSGGDSQGMNCAVRAIVRAAIARGCEAYAVLEGYQGLVDGGDKMIKMSWADVRKYTSVSGTIIGTARCKDFRSKEGRLKAALNLIESGIEGLVVIGGDGSLTGADIFRSEWPSLVSQLLEMGRISSSQSESYSHLKIVGLVGSIDNDMAGTDFTIGAISSLHRICESVDNITSTALSHQRVFVVEVMGRHCGWLALMSGICTGADYVLIPEQPLGKEEWKTKMCKAIKTHREMGRRSTIVIVSEGATDNELNPIKSEEVAKVITDKLGLDTRVTYLGHVQRGGVPCAQDRILGAVQGIQAVDTLLKSSPSEPSMMIGMKNNHVIPVPLMDAVKKTQELTALVSERKFDDAMKLRDPAFIALWDSYCHSEYNPELTDDSKFEKMRIGIINIGAPAGGMNAAARTMSRIAINYGHTPVAIHNGIRGLINGEFHELNWLQVGNWMARGGSEIGTNRELPSIDYGQVAYQLQKNNITALFVVGGFEAYRSVHQLMTQRHNYPSFCMPIAYVPATISNNVPGTDYSLGCDTSLNAVTEACDRITQSASASHSRVFVVEVQGGRSGFLATLAGISVGASRVYIPEEGINLNDLANDVSLMKKKFYGDQRREDSINVGRIILKTDEASSTYQTQFISEIFADEGKSLFDSRTSVLGHIQQGGTTSPVDRMHANLFAHRSFLWIDQQIKQVKHLSQQERQAHFKTNQLIVVVGNREGSLEFTPLNELEDETDWINRRPRNPWWKPYVLYNRILSHYEHEIRTI